MIRVVIVDDQRMMRELLKEYVTVAPDINVIGSASNGKEALEEIRTLKPDVVLMDIEMPVMDGLTTTRMLGNQGSTAKILVVSANYDDKYLAQALRNGAQGYLLKTTSPTELIEAIRGVHNGSLQFGSGILQKELSSLSFANGNGKAVSKSVEVVADRSPTRKLKDTVANSSDNAKKVEATVVNVAKHGNPPAALSAGTGSRPSPPPTPKGESAYTSLAGLEIELSRIRAGYWVLKTKLQTTYNWLIGLTVATVVQTIVILFLLLLGIS
jgi:DNA-binding NarL/FixJ family response regulator